MFGLDYPVLVVILVFVAIFVTSPWLWYRVIRKAGYSGWWTLMIFVPVGNVLVIWLFAFSPAQRGEDSRRAIGQQPALSRVFDSVRSSRLPGRRPDHLLFELQGSAPQRSNEVKANNGTHRGR